MQSKTTLPYRIVSVAAIVIGMMTGCHHCPTVPGLGDLSDPIWQNQERNAEMSDFVVYDHEFQAGTEWLNTDGEDHVKKVASRLLEGQDAVVVIERTRMSPRGNTEYKYPVHTNPALDMRRREVVSLSLAAMGITDADERVIVAPSPAQGLRSSEAESGYRNSMGGAGGNFGAQGGFGGFFFGGGSRF